MDEETYILGGEEWSGNMDEERYILLSISLDCLRDSVLYPLELVSVLNQIGYSPKDSGKDHCVQYGISKYQYVSEVYEIEGLLGFSRGLISFVINNLLHDLSGATAAQLAPSLLLQHVYFTSQENFCTQRLDCRLSVVSLRILFGVLLSHPFHVLSTRQAAQYVGKEVIYSSIFGLFYIYYESGLFGYYYGFFTRLFCELVIGWIVETTDFFMRRFLAGLQEETPPEVRANYFLLTHGELCILVAKKIARFLGMMLISSVDRLTTNLEISNTSLKASALCPENKKCCISLFCKSRLKQV